MPTVHPLPAAWPTIWSVVWIAFGRRIFGTASISATVANRFIPIGVVRSRRSRLRSSTIRRPSNSPSTRTGVPSAVVLISPTVRPPKRSRRARHVRRTLWYPTRLRVNHRRAVGCRHERMATPGRRRGFRRGPALARRRAVVLRLPPAGDLPGDVRRRTCRGVRRARRPTVRHGMAPRRHLRRGLHDRSPSDV